ncbi:RNA-directed DNA polymerase (reverse transcriptase)-related family protein [Rhynchospora pubera]|uniref:RNA-directed DNA polymerase (Reverse transcriptase)-related family protein n=1 Tax=Rhynchospora pubera TaxID=906938 RepID=A0AAV8DGR5_9POAL|nr:RNA-directed DNA polymerase (reverse transcriptase)-related family protein [Rhynchospora pubera]
MISSFLVRQLCSKYFEPKAYYNHFARFQGRESAMINPIFDSRGAQRSNKDDVLHMSASRPAHFDQLVNKVQRRISTWAAKSLSQAGKIVLIRSVVEPLIVFNTAGGPLPATVASKIEMMIRSFFWENGGKQKMHLISWDRITLRKEEGGLGLRKVQTINGAMMLKILWKVASREHEDSPWVKLLRAKYLTMRTLWLSGEPRRCTKLWRALMQYRQVLQPHVQWQIGTGDKCMVFGEPWHDLWQAMTPVSSRQRSMRLQELTEPTGQGWSHNSLADNLGVPVGLRIITLHPRPPMKLFTRSDRLLYTRADSGKFNFKEASLLLPSHTPSLPQPLTSILKVIWHIPGLLPRVRLFLWKLVNDALPLRGTCASRLRQQIPACQICGDGPDLPLHALFLCPFAETYRFASSLRMSNLSPDILGILYTICQSMNGPQFTSFANNLWALWKSRCSHIYEGSPISTGTIAKLAANYNPMSRLVSSLKIPKPLTHLWHTAASDASGGFSCFVDGSFNPPNSGGWAYVLFFNGLLQQYELGSGHAYSAFGTEIQTMHMVVRAAIQLGIELGTFFTDCLQLQQILEGRTNLDSVPWQDFHSTVELTSLFRLQHGYSCSFVPRESNQESHMLANYARLHRISFLFDR